MCKKVILWDCDGTLIHSNESFLCSLADALEKFGYHFERNEIKEFLVKVCSWHNAEKEHTDEIGEKWWIALLIKFRDFCNEHNVSKDNCELIFETFRKNVIDFDYKLYDDTKIILEYCKEKGYENYLLSNNFPELIEVIERLEIDKYFTDYFLSANIGYEKPRKEIYEYVMKKVGTSQVCYMIGDNPVADIKAGNNAGLKTILVHNDIDGTLADYVCNELIEIKEIIA